MIPRNYMHIMWSHQAKAVTWVYAIHCESVQSAVAARVAMHTFTVNCIHPNECFCLMAPHMDIGPRVSIRTNAHQYGNNYFVLDFKLQ